MLSTYLYEYDNTRNEICYREFISMQKFMSSAIIFISYVDINVTISYPTPFSFPIMYYQLPNTPLFPYYVLSATQHPFLSLLCTISYPAPFSFPIMYYQLSNTPFFPYYVLSATQHPFISLICAISYPTPLYFPNMCYQLPNNPLFP